MNSNANNQEILNEGAFGKIFKEIIKTKEGAIGIGILSIITIAQTVKLYRKAKRAIKDNRDAHRLTNYTGILTDSQISQIKFCKFWKDDISKFINGTSDLLKLIKECNAEKEKIWKEITSVQNWRDVSDQDLDNWETRLNKIRQKLRNGISEAKSLSRESLGIPKRNISDTSTCCTDVSEFKESYNKIRPIIAAMQNSDFYISCDADDMWEGIPFMDDAYIEMCNREDEDRKNIGGMDSGANRRVEVIYERIVDMFTEYSRDAISFENSIDDVIINCIPQMYVQLKGNTPKFTTQTETINMLLTESIQLMSN